MTGTTRRRLPTGTITFLFSDIEGSTRLVQDLGPAAYRKVLERHNTLLRAAFGRHGGTERGTQGDSFLIVFREASEAVAAAIDAQRAIAGASWPAGRPVRVRMGLHTGSGQTGGDDYVGVDVNRAARIAAAAHGGQVLLSSTTVALVEGSPLDGVSLRHLGEHRLRDFARGEQLSQLVIDGLPADFPPPRAESVATGDLPTRLTSFVGREAELATLESLLETNRLLTLIGPGGTGKTSLATELARRVEARYRDGAWFVPLETVRDPELVVATIATRLRIVAEAADQGLDRLIGFLAKRDLLLVLDNFEQVLPAATIVGSVLRGAPGVRIMVTSRAPLRVAGEQEFPLDPLPLPAAVATLDSASASDSVVLFVERARRSRPSFTLTEDNAAAIAEICTRLDGLPLGIELAAGRIGLLDPRTIADRLRRNLDLPGRAASDLPERQRTLERAVAWSHDLLSSPARILLARLGAFTGGCRLEELESVCGPASEIGADPLEPLSELVEHSLVRPASGAEGPRYGLLETIRLFAIDRLVERGEADEIRRRHCLTYLAFAEDAARHLPGGDQVAWLARMTDDHDNLRSAIRWAMENDLEAALRFTHAMWRFWQLKGHVSEGLDTVDQVLALPGSDAPTVARMRALEAAGGLHYWRAEQEVANDLYQGQLELAEQLGDDLGVADAVFNMAHTKGLLANFELATSLIEDAAQRYAKLGDELGLARSTWARGILRQAQGDFETSVPYFEEARKRAIELGDAPYLALSAGSLSWAAVQGGRVAEGVRRGVEALVANHALGDVATTTVSLQAGAILMTLMDLPTEAATVYGAFEALSTRHGVRPPAGLGELMGVFWKPELIVAAIGEAGFAEAMAVGSQFSLDEAVDYVVRTAEEGLRTGAFPSG